MAGEDTVASIEPAPAHVEAPKDGDEQTAPLPTAASTTARATVAWWVVFSGPAVVAASLVVAGIVGDRGDVVSAFAIGVWAFTLTLGLAAAPRSRSGFWWVVPLLLSFTGGALAFALLFAMSGLSDHITTKDKATTSTSAVSSTTSRSNRATPPSSSR